MIGHIATAFVLAGIGALTASLFLNRRLIAMLPAGNLRKYWRVMMALTIFFVLGYISYLFVFGRVEIEFVGLLVPTIFFFGACFVWLTAMLALRTAEGVRRIALLEQEIVTDPLTKMFNRRYLDRRLDEEIARAKRYGTPLSVMLLDLDHFKDVNDRFGHRSGDHILVQVAAVVMTGLRQTDFAARYGGEEFVVVAPQTGLTSAAAHAERIRSSIESCDLSLPPDDHGRRPLDMTVSIGVACLAEHCADAEALLHAADTCLYRAKRLGRNRIVTTETPRSSPVVGPPAAVAAA